MAPRLTARDKQLRAILEADFQASVEDLLKLHRWRYFHAPANIPRTGPGGKRWVQNVRAGFPDLVAVRAPRLIFAELKREADGIVSDDQQKWMDALRASGQEVYLWRPSQMNEIARILA